MDSGTDTLAYQLYTDPARSLVFGDGGTGNTVPVNGAGYGIPATVTVYGRVTQAAAGGATGGNYTDVVNVTVLF
jgi:spore coat protein U-like protein